MFRITSLAALALLAGCTEDDTSSDYVGGTFTVTIEAVDDDCQDGGFEVLFMPEGTPTDFANPIELPALEDLPMDSTVTLQAPYAVMPVTWEAGESEDTLVIIDAAQTDVVLDEESYGDCTADMSISVDLTILDADTITATAVLTTGGYESSGDTCPEPTSDPCDITLDLSGTSLSLTAE